MSVRVCSAQPLTELTRNIFLLFFSSVTEQILKASLFQSIVYEVLKEDKRYKEGLRKVSYIFWPLGQVGLLEMKGRE